MPPEITQAVINAMVVIIGALAAFVAALLVNAGLRARANARLQEIELQKQKDANKAAADEKALAVEREKAFMQQYSDTRAEVTELRKENSQREKDNLDLYKKVVTLEAQLEIVKVSRDERERQLNQEIQARKQAEEKLEAAQKEWAVERDQMRAEIDDLKRRLRAVEGIRATPQTELPAVKVEMQPEVMP